MNKLVGNEGFGYTRVVRALQNSPSSGVLKNYISTLKVGLDIQDKDDTLDPLTRGLRQGDMELSFVLEKVLKLWRTERSQEATLGKLITVFLEKDLNDFADELKKEFKEEIEKDPVILTATVNNLPIPTQAATANAPSMSAVVIDIKPEELCTLDFEDHDVKHVVLQTLAPDIPNVLTTVNGNQTALLQINALNVFDYIEIEEIIQGQFRTERERITKLVGLLHYREPEEIRLCLEKLCNLDGMLERRKQFRKCFNDKFPGCVKRRPSPN